MHPSLIGWQPSFGMTPRRTLVEQVEFARPKVAIDVSAWGMPAVRPTTCKLRAFQRSCIGAEQLSELRLNSVH